MRFLVSRSENMMAIDNVAISMDCSSLSSSIEYVVWNENNSGFLEPSSGVALRTPFSDPSPYQPLVNSWMGNAAGLTLAQAQAVKSELVAAIGAVKRQLPITVTLSTGSQTFDGSDQAVARYASLVNVAMAALINSDIVAPGNANASAGATGTDVVTNNASVWNTENAWFNGIFGPPGGGTYVEENMSGLSNSYANLTALPTGTIQIVPLGSTSLLTLTPADMLVLANAAQAQFATNQVNAAVKQAAVAGLSTVAAAIAYDATTGW